MMHENDDKLESIGVFFLTNIRSAFRFQNIFSEKNYD